MKRTLLFALSTVFFVPALTGCALLSSQGRARNSVAKWKSEEMGRSHKAYYQENQAFALSLEALDLEPENFKDATDLVSMEVTENMAVHSVQANRRNLYENRLLGRVVTLPWHGSGRLYSYVSATAVLPTEGKGEPTIIGIVCESEKPGNVEMAAPIIEGEDLVCAADTQPVATF